MFLVTTMVDLCCTLNNLLLQQQANNNQQQQQQAKDLYLYISCFNLNFELKIFEFWDYNKNRQVENKLSI
jgi:hypothetical protein